jgi:hypothetical protein
LGEHSHVIKIHSNISRAACAPRNPFKLFGSATDYYEDVAEKTNDNNDWKSLRLYKMIEPSNDLLFSNVSRNTLVVELTGTVKHLSIIDGKHCNIYAAKRL